MDGLKKNDLSALSEALVLQLRISSTTAEIVCDVARFDRDSIREVHSFTFIDSESVKFERGPAWSGSRGSSGLDYRARDGSSNIVIEHVIRKGDELTFMLGR